MNRKITISDGIFRIVNGAFMLAILCVMLYPFLYVAFASVSDPNAMMRHSGLLLKPYGFQLGAYKLVWANPMIRSGYINTIILVIGGTAINMLITALSAYVLSRRNLMFKPFLMVMALVTMYFSGGLIPLYLQVNRLGIANTLWALILPTAMSTYNLIIMRTSFMSLPLSLEESARIDGANDFTILFRIVLPLTKATVAVMILFYSVNIWNAWFYAMIFVRDRALFPLQLVLREILIVNDTSNMTVGMTGDKLPISESVKYATIMAATLPILFVYPFVQKHFVKGVMIGAVKG